MTARRTTRPARGPLGLVAVALAAMLVLTGCSDGADGPDSGTDPSASSSPTPTPSESEDPGTSEDERTEPACASVWVAGQELPKPYRGCFDVERERWVEADVYHCSSGQRLVTYRRTFYAVHGKPVIETAGPRAVDRDFAALMKTCGA